VESGRRRSVAQILASAAGRANLHGVGPVASGGTNGTREGKWRPGYGPQSQKRAELGRGRRGVTRGACRRNRDRASFPVYVTAAGIA
jgi:hypothetical protein